MPRPRVGLARRIKSALPPPPLVPACPLCSSVCLSPTFAGYLYPINWLKKLFVHTRTLKVTNGITYNLRANRK